MIMINKIISQFGTNYKKRGVNMWYQCPFHNGKSFTSFSVDSQTGLYYCFNFNCGAKGSVNKQTKEEFKAIKQETKQEQTEYKQPSYSADGCIFFKKYIETRFINPDVVDNLAGFIFGYYYNQNKNTNTIKLIVNDSASYNYVTDSQNKKIWKGWSKGSQAKPFKTYHKIKYNKETINKNIYIFEGLEDLLSFIELYNTDIDYSCSVFICLFGITNINKIKINTQYSYYLCLDNDKAGAETLTKYSVYENTFKVELAINNKIIDSVKDWNELLIKYKEEIL